MSPPMGRKERITFTVSIGGKITWTGVGTVRAWVQGFICRGSCAGWPRDLRDAVDDVEQLVAILA